MRDLLSEGDGGAANGSHLLRSMVVAVEQRGLAVHQALAETAIAPAVTPTVEEVA